VAAFPSCSPLRYNFLCELSLSFFPLYSLPVLLFSGYSLNVIRKTRGHIPSLPFACPPPQFVLSLRKQIHEMTESSFLTYFFTHFVKTFNCSQGFSCVPNLIRIIICYQLLLLGYFFHYLFLPSHVIQRGNFPFFLPHSNYGPVFHRLKKL